MGFALTLSFIVIDFASAVMAKLAKDSRFDLFSERAELFTLASVVATAGVVISALAELLS